MQIRSRTVFDGNLMFENSNPTMTVMKGNLSIDTFEPLAEVQLMSSVIIEQDAMVMGDATLVDVTDVLGTLILTDKPVDVAAGGVVVPIGSNLSITNATEPILRIAPAAVDGTILELRFGETLDAFASPNEITSCEALLTCDEADHALRPNVRLKEGSEVFLYKEGDVIRLVSEGLNWKEVFRSSGHVNVFSIQKATLAPFSAPVPPGGMFGFDINCVDPPEGQPNGLILYGAVQAFEKIDTPDGPVPGPVIDILINDEIESADVDPTLGPTDIYLITGENTSGVDVIVIGTVRCVAF